MQEIEVKILEINKEELIKKLEKIGAEFAFEIRIRDKQFDFPDKRIKNANELCRLRSIGDKVEMGYKDGRHSDGEFSITEETELVVADFDTMEKILNKIGLTAYVDREKNRTEYVKGNVKFEIEVYPTIPPYLELEGPKEEIAIVLKELGYTMEDTTDITATQVLKHYGVDPKIQKFS